MIPRFLLPLLAASSACAFRMTVQSGAVCTGHTLHEDRLNDDLCHRMGVNASEEGAASAVYITFSGSNDLDFAVQFFDSLDCSGAAVAQGDNGCLDLATVERTPRSLRRVPMPGSDGSGGMPPVGKEIATLLSPHDTWNAARRLVGLADDSLQPFDEPKSRWFVIWPGQWMVGEVGYTLAAVLDWVGFEDDCPFPDLNFVDDDARDYDPDESRDKASDAGNDARSNSHGKESL